jgi:hypothetical protein
MLAMALLGWSDEAHGYSPLTPQCIERAANFVGVDALALWMVLRTEGGSLGTIHRNADGSDDLGPFQINTGTLRALASRLSLPFARLEHIARDEGCPAAILAGFILREKIAGRKDGDIWDGLADYNSRTPAPHQRYLDRLRESYSALTKKPAR